jgi:hypothetical protein
LCLRKLFLAKIEVQEELAKLNTVEQMNGAVMTSLKLLDPPVNGINGKSVNGKTKTNGTKNGLKNGHSKVDSTGVCNFLEVSLQNRVFWSI